MKTAIKTLFAAALTAVVLTSSAFTTFAIDGGKKLSGLAKISGYDMIQVKGNVKVYLRQSQKEKISVSTNEATDQVYIQQSGRKLLISSTASTPAEVYVSVTDLRRIDVSDHAYLETEGNFNLQALQVFLEGNGQANVNTKTASLYTVIKDHSALKLKGCTDDHTYVRADASKMNTVKFSAIKTISAQPMIAAIDLDQQFAESIDLGRTAFRTAK